MLEEIRIQNFAIIENLELDFATGFNVITGETGAGKSIIIDAVELLLGGKADTAMIRSGAEKAVIEGTFALRGEASKLVLPILIREQLLEDETARFVTLTRELRQSGRSNARINGISVRAEILKEVGSALVDIHGQSEHMSLFATNQHIELLDRYADLLEIREALATVVHRLGGVRSEIRSLMEDKAALQRRAEQLRRDVEEIDAAELEPGEEDDLKAERTRLANSEQLATLTGEVVTILNGETTDDFEPAVDLLMQVATAMGKLAAIDPDLNELAELAEGISTQAQELSIEMASYADEIEYDPQRLNDIEERLEVINRLKRRFGVTIELVLENAEKMRTELDNLENSEERLEALAKEETKLLMQIGEMSENISKVRGDIGKQLSKRVVQELKDLRMERTQFEVALTHRDDPKGCIIGDRRYAFTETGIDQVEFMMSANPGEPMRPLAKVASGGEAARIMLALKRVLTQADHTPTLIFDEVDQGIGGRIGSVVGEKLWGLSAAHQVLVVTHLAQLAGYADRHYHVRKSVANNRTATQVTELQSEEDRVTELAEMLGATGEGSRKSAMEILDEVQSKKVSAGRASSTTQQKLL